MVKNNAANVFQTYANVYDSLYRNKNYESECDFLEEVFRRYREGDVKSILDLGCGTGGHTILMARRGYKVCGVDRSAEMLTIAQEKAQVSNLSAHLRFQLANIQNVNLEQIFDAVICMFAVLGYQTSNEELFATLRTVRRHLNPGGLFICDFWYGPAVLKQRPTDRVKIVQDDDDRIIRLVEPKIDTLSHVVKVNYHVIRFRGDKLVEESQEMHPMRFIFKPEIEFLMSQADLRLVHFCPFAKLDQAVSEETWNVSAIARAV